MNLSDLLKFGLGDKSTDDESANADSPVLAAETDFDAPVYISGTSSELYDSHFLLDLGVWSDTFDDF